MRQIPTPWLGFLESASFLAVTTNPEFAFGRGYPAKSKDGDWYTGVGADGPWTEQKVETFCEAHFDAADGIRKFEQTLLKYVLAIHDEMRETGRAVLADEPRMGRDVAVTSMVHCPTSRRVGVRTAWGACYRHFESILKLFLTNGAPFHVLLIIGSEDKYCDKVVDFLDRTLGRGRYGIHDVPVGGYDWEANWPIYRQICLREYPVDERNLLMVYYHLPKPGHAMDCCRNIVLHKRRIFADERPNERTEESLRIASTVDFEASCLKGRRMPSPKFKKLV